MCKWAEHSPRLYLSTNLRSILAFRLSRLRSCYSRALRKSSDSSSRHSLSFSSSPSSISPSHAGFVDEPDLGASLALGGERSPQHSRPFPFTAPRRVTILEE